MARSLLQYVGTDVVRAKNPDYWVDFVSDILNLFDGRWDYVIIPDTRFPNEFNRLKERGFNAVHLRVVRPDFASQLTEEQQTHLSETALNDIAPDYVIVSLIAYRIIDETESFIVRASNSNSIRHIDFLITDVTYLSSVIFSSSL